MPSLGADMESGTLIEWLVKPGDRVHRGDIVAVVETDKGAIEIEIFEDATVAELLVMTDTEVAVGTPLARLDAVGEHMQARPDFAKEPSVVAPERPSQPMPQSAAEPLRPAAPPLRPAAEPLRPAAQPLRPAAEPLRPAAEPLRPAAQPLRPAPSPSIVMRRKISPAARKHARENGVDLDLVVGTGDGGVVTVADVEQFAHTAGARPAAPTPAPPAETAARGGAGTSLMRRAIATAMSRSKREIPHYYLAHTIDLEPAFVWLERRNAQVPIERRVVHSALLLKAVARAAAENRTLNGYWRDGTFEGRENVDVGVVVSLRGGGLAAPVLRNVAALDIDAVMVALKDATERARRGRLKSSELSGATITVSSLGDTGVESIYPIIHQPQVAIVGFGAVVTRPWVVGGGLHVRRVVTVTLAADHRASDGHDGARFLSAIERLLAKPEAL